MQSNLDQTQIELRSQMERERLQASENSRIRQALDNVSTNVLVSDNQLEVIYINRAAEKLFRKNEKTISQDLSNFNADNLIGCNIDTFYKDPSHQRKLLLNLQATLSSEINIGGCIFNTIANPILDENHDRLGTVVEWIDLTEQRNAEKQIEQAISSAVAGKLSARLDASGFEGFMKTLAENINELLNAIISPLNVAANYVEKISMGDIPPPITEEYQGDFNTIKNNLNRCIDAINLLIQDTDNLANAAIQGQLDTRADESQHMGDFRKIITGVNNALDAIVQPINECANIMAYLAEGDLTHRIKNNYQGDFSTLAEAVNTSISNLLELIGKILSATTNVDSAASEIASGIADLSRRTEQQASALEETSSSMEQISISVNKNAEHAEVANNLSKESQTKAVAGGEIVNSAINSMTKINESSKKITDIIGVIDDIAFQTNLLALNAAVEAARAGEQGRGFAVVAGEVRNLAQRSASAAREIKELISDSVDKIKEGSELVNKSGETLSEIVIGVDDVGKMVADISTASAEQSSGITQITQAINQMDEVTQQNAALVEQASAASKAMSEEASSMKTLISVFKA